MVAIEKHAHRQKCWEFSTRRPQKNVTQEPPPTILIACANPGFVRNIDPRQFRHAEADFGCPGTGVVAGSILGSGASNVMGAFGRVESTEKI